VVSPPNHREKHAAMTDLRQLAYDHDQQAPENLPKRVTLSLDSQLASDFSLEAEIENFR
jgi:hypothetical protein